MQRSTWASHKSAMIIATSGAASVIDSYNVRIACG
jgi:hypothetical protein